MLVEKDKLPKGFSYALKTSKLEEAINEANIETDLHLIYCGPPSKMPLFAVEFWLPNQNVEYDRFYIRSGVVESGNRKTVEGIVNSKVIPSFIDWALDIISLPINSTKRVHGARFIAEYIDGDLWINGKRC